MGWLRCVKATLGGETHDFRRCADVEWGLTFDMSGSHKWAKPACDCPFDGRVRAQLTHMPVIPRAATRKTR